MFVYPAIDIIGGNVVRLTNGDYSAVKKYSVSPIGAALSFNECGATHLHAVDLDGAASGRADNAETVKQIIARSKMFVEIGGGIRTREQIERYLSAGADRVVLGTVAVKNFSFAEKMCSAFPGRVAVGVDARDGFVAVNGWKEVTDIKAYEFCQRLAGAGIENVIYTDISRDGALSGTNLGAYEKLMKIPDLKVTASGGITYLSEIKALKEMGVYAVILGKALYENKLDLRRAVALAEGV